jgi:hypothetical protein
MIVLKALKDMKLNGKLMHDGDYIRTGNPKIFLERGVARRITTEEVLAILNDYIEYAKKLFNKSQHAPLLIPGKQIGIHVGQESLPL